MERESNTERDRECDKREREKHLATDVGTKREKQGQQLENQRKKTYTQRYGEK